MRDKCIICGCYDLNTAREETDDLICPVCRDERTYKPNRYTVFRMPYKIYRNIFGILKERKHAR